jgi:hypothetical protein
MNSRDNLPSARCVRPWFLTLSAFVLLCAIAAVWTRWHSAPLPKSFPQAEPVVSEPRAPARPHKTLPRSQTVTSQSLEQSAAQTVPRMASPLPQPTRFARQLVQAITRLDRANVPLTPEEAEQWKKNLAELLQQGADGAAAIAEFLQSNTDVRLGRAGLELLGVNSVREALFDALVHIGGPEAISATLQTIQNTADPREVAVLARNLDTLAPEQYRQDALSAARDVLNIAGTGKLPGSDVAPLFEVLQSYGGADVVPELQQAAGNWQFYSAIALASLPEGAGIPALAQMAESKESGTTMALQLLAQLSGKQNSAQTALLMQAQAGGIPASTWPFLTTALAGNQYHFENSVLAAPQVGHRGTVSTANVRAGNQTFYDAFTPANLTQDEAQSRLTFISQLRNVTSQPAALEALQRAERLLMERLPNIAVRQ